MTCWEGHFILWLCGRTVARATQSHQFDSHLFSLLDLQLREEVDEPLEGPLVAVDPEEVDLYGDKAKLWFSMISVVR